MAATPTPAWRSPASTPRCASPATTTSPRSARLPLSDFSRGASLSLQWTQEVLEPAQPLLPRRTCDSEAQEGPVGLYHASPRDPVWEYVLSTLLAELCLDRQRERIGLIGHSHVALSFGRVPGQLASGGPHRDGTQLDLGDGEWLLNPGSVGQPRDGDPRAAWLLLDLGAWAASYRRTPYDVAGAAAAIRAARLPDSLAERLEYGQ